MARACGVLLLLCAVFLLAGCGGGPQKASVSGKVTLDGKALPEGEIYFLTAGSGKAPEILDIEDGQFSGKVTVGEKTIRILAYKEGELPKDTPIVPGDTASKENYIPDKYNTNTTLKKEVKAEGNNNFTFELKTE